LSSLGLKSSLGAELEKLSLNSSLDDAELAKLSSKSNLDHAEHAELSLKYVQRV
jgi:hypothetical protein